MGNGVECCLLGEKAFSFTLASGHQLIVPHSPIWFFVICAGVNKVKVFRRTLLFLSLPGNDGNDLKQRSGNVNIWSVKSELALLEGGAN